MTTVMADSGSISTEEDRTRLLAPLENRFFIKGDFKMDCETLSKMSQEEITEALYQEGVKYYESKEAFYGDKLMREMERVVMLRVVDEYWMDQIDAMDDLKQGITLRAYANTDPVVAYKKEGYEMFDAMVQAIREETVRRAFVVQMKVNQEMRREKVAKESMTAGSASDQTVKQQPVRKVHKVGPNDPCPCGSGKKYKKCCRDKDLMQN